MNNDHKSLIDIVTSLSPFEFTFLASVVGYTLGIGLNVNQQNALGNWFELVGQILLTLSAQGSFSLTSDEYLMLLKDIEDLKQNKK